MTILPIARHEAVDWQVEWRVRKNEGRAIIATQSFTTDHYTSVATIEPAWADGWFQFNLDIAE